MVILFSAILFGSENKNEQAVNDREMRVVNNPFKSAGLQNMFLKEGFVIAIRNKIVEGSKVLLAEYSENVEDYLLDKKKYILVHGVDLENKSEPLDVIRLKVFFPILIQSFCVRTVRG